MIGFIKSFIHSWKLDKALSKGFYGEECTYKVGSELYNEYQKGKELAIKSNIEKKEKLYKLIFSLKEINRDEFERLIKPLGNKYDLLTEMLNVVKNFKDEIQVGGAFYMGDYDKEISIIERLGYSVKEVRYGYGTYSRVCLKIKQKVK